MHAFTTLYSLVVPLDRANVDTDAILPKQFMKSIKRTGFGPNLFDEWRYLDHGEPGMDCSIRPLNPGFPLNHPRYHGAQILLGRENFGCGSSREHAVWALDGYGTRALLAPSYADIFYVNCLRNGMLPVILKTGEIDALFHDVQVTPEYAVRIDLPTQTVTTPKGCFTFDIDAFRKECLLRRLDDIELTLRHVDAIRSYEECRFREEPWIFQ
jgi:3-isopropylmalate/(R)-2-methylmalate dehydratase small subunit